MKILDYHCHLPWDRNTNVYDVDAVIKDMDENKISIRLLSAIQGYSCREQNEAVLNAVKKHPDKLLACAVVNPKERDYKEVLQFIAENKEFVALELDSLEHSYYPESEPRINEIFQFAEENELIINVFTGWGPRTMPAQWGFYAKKFPKVKVVLLHMGTTDFGYGCIDLLKEVDNLYAETSCMYEFPILRKAFAQVSPWKFVFGSHFPDKITKCSIDTFDLLNLSDEFRKQLYFENAANLLHLIQSV